MLPPQTLAVARTLEERQRRLENVLDTVSVNVAANERVHRASIQHLTHQARAAAATAFEKEGLESQLLTLRAAASASEAQDEQRLLSLKLAQAATTTARTRLADAELVSRLQRLQYAESAARSAALAKRLARKLALARWRQLAAGRALQASRRTFLPERAFEALRRARDQHAHGDIAGQGDGPGTASEWSLDGWLADLPLPAMVARAMRARLLEGNDEVDAHRQRSLVAALSDTDEPASVVAELFAETSLAQRLADAVADEAEALADALKRGEATRRKRQLRLQRIAAQSALAASDGGLSPSPLYGRMVTDEGTWSSAVRASGMDDGACSGTQARSSASAAGSATSATSATSTIVAMRAEHCALPDARTPFVVWSYEIRTSAEIEWTFIVDPTSVGLASLGLTAWPAQGRAVSDAEEEQLDGTDQTRGDGRRKPLPLSAFEKQRAATSQRLLAVTGTELSREALVGCRLYTGSK
jgi:hypothetical protein